MSEESNREDIPTQERENRAEAADRVLQAPLSEEDEERIRSRLQQLGYIE